MRAYFSTELKGELSIMESTVLEAIRDNIELSGEITPVMTLNEIREACSFKSDWLSAIMTKLKKKGYVRRFKIRNEDYTKGSGKPPLNTAVELLKEIPTASDYYEIPENAERILPNLFYVRTVFKEAGRPVTVFELEKLCKYYFTVNELRSYIRHLKVNGELDIIETGGLKEYEFFEKNPKTLGFNTKMLEEVSIQDAITLNTIHKLHKNKDGEIYCSPKRLSPILKMDYKSVLQALIRLENNGYIRKEGRGEKMQLTLIKAPGVQDFELLTYDTDTKSRPVQYTIRTILEREGYPMRTNDVFDMMPWNVSRQAIDLTLKELVKRGEVEKCDNGNKNVTYKRVVY